MSRHDGVNNFTKEEEMMEMRTNIDLFAPHDFDLR